MKVGIVNYGQVVEDISRLDGKFHLSDGMEALKAVEKNPYETNDISEVSTGVFNAARFKRTYVGSAKRGTPFFGIIGMLSSSFNNPKFLSDRYTSNLDSLFVGEGWTLIACSGSGVIGTPTYANKMFEDKAFSQHIIRVVPDKEKIKAGFLFAYLASKYGKNIVKKGIYGTAIPEIEPDYVSSIPVPLFPDSLQEEIHDLVIKAATLRVEADEALEFSIRFFDHLSIDYKAGGKRIEMVNISSVNSGYKRLDSSYAVISNLISSLFKKSGYQTVRIKDQASDIFIGPRAKRNYLEKGVPFLSTSAMQKGDPT
jgi:type I restriction enzyme S subunit